jgi:hypothetical protein
MAFRHRVAPQVLHSATTSQHALNIYRWRDIAFACPRAFRLGSPLLRVGYVNGFLSHDDLLCEGGSGFR